MPNPVTHPVRALRAVLATLFLAVLALPRLPAAEALPETGEDAAQASATFLDLLLEHGLYINIVLMALALLGLFLFLHTMLLTRRGVTLPKGLLQRVLDDIQSGQEEKALKRTEESRSLLGRVLRPALRLHHYPVERLHQAVEGTGRRLVGGLRQEAAYLANIGVLSPMIGLLGTVLGMITAFESFSAELDVSAKQAMLTAAIGKALITTAAGLVVGIPAMAAHYWVMGRVGRISDELELASESVIATLRETT